LRDRELAGRRARTVLAVVGRRAAALDVVGDVVLVLLLVGRRLVLLGHAVWRKREGERFG